MSLEQLVLSLDVASRKLFEPRDRSRDHPAWFRVDVTAHHMEKADKVQRSPGERMMALMAAGVDGASACRRLDQLRHCIELEGFVALIVLLQRSIES
jgi:hypothetical protein